MAIFIEKIEFEEKQFVEIQSDIVDYYELIQKKIYSALCEMHTALNEADATIEYVDDSVVPNEILGEEGDADRRARDYIIIYHLNLFVQNQVNLYDKLKRHIS